MDPNANLEQQLTAARYIIAQSENPPWASEEFGGLSDNWGDEQDRSEWFEELANAGGTLATLVLALDEWLTKGGFAPQAWTPPAEVLESVRELLAYNWSDEERDFEENPPDEVGKGHHIYERMQTIDAWLRTVNA